MNDAVHRPGSGATWASLHSRPFRRYLTGQLAAHTGMWMVRIAQDWTVLELTGSSTAVGATITLQFLPLLLLGPLGGLAADRFPKHRVLLATQSCFGLIGLALALPAFCHTITAGQLYGAALVCGLAGAVDNPTRQSFVGELVPTTALPNAVSLNIAVFQLARIAGPAAAGGLLRWTGAGWSLGLDPESWTRVMRLGPA